MAKFVDLPQELHQWVCKHLDLESLKALAFVCRSTSPSAREILNKNIHVQLTTGKVQGVHNVLAHLIIQACSTTQLPNVAITSTGDEFTDRILKFASYVKAITLSMPSTNGTASPVTNQQLKGQYMWLVSNLDIPDTVGAESWDSKFRRGSMENMLYFLLRIARNVTTLEFGGSLLSMAPTFTQGICDNLRTLRFVGLSNNSWVPSTYAQFARLPLLETLEFVSMSVKIQSVHNLGNNLSVSRLRFVNCHVMTVALAAAVQMCNALEEFEYTLDHTFLQRNDFNLARLLYQLRTHHTATLTNLTIRSDRYLLGRYHHAEEIAQLTALRTLSMNYELLLFGNQNGGPQHYQNYRAQKAFFTADHRYPPTAVEIFLSLPSSLETINFHICPKSPEAESVLRSIDLVLRLLRLVSEKGKPLERLPNLASITFSI